MSLLRSCYLVRVLEAKISLLKQVFDFLERFFVRRLCKAFPRLLVCRNDQSNREKGQQKALILVSVLN